MKNIDNMYIEIEYSDRHADKIIATGNMFNTEPESGQEYLLIALNIYCNKPSNERCVFNPYDFKALGKNGVLVDPNQFLAGVDGILNSTELMGGGQTKGKLFYLVLKDDPSTVLLYDSLLGNDYYFGINN